MPSRHGGAHRSAWHRPPEPERALLKGHGLRILLLVAASATMSVAAAAVVGAMTSASYPLESARRSLVVTSPARPTVVATTVPNIAVLGDSVPAATGCACAGFGDLLARVAASSASGKATLLNASQGGMTSTDLLAQLDDASSVARASLAGASIVTVTVGANDFEESEAQHDGCGGATNTACYSGKLTELAVTMRAVLGRIHSLTSAGTQLLVTGYWNVFLDGDVGAKQGPTYVTTSDALTREVNAVIQEAANETGSTYVDLYGPFKGSGERDDTPLLAADGDHPSEAGHRLIAAVLARAVGLNPAPVIRPGLRWGLD